jgi:hypothetical protein
MQSIILIGTRHGELGKCNSSELYKIIETINPEIIFEEIPPSWFDDYYLNKSRGRLEADAILMYLENYKIRQIPVDSDDIPSESFFKKHKSMHERIEGLADINGHSYRTLTDMCKQQVEVHGFKYLNSQYYVNFCDGIGKAVEGGLQSINNAELFQIHELWKNIHEKREIEMLQNIYNYSKKFDYQNAVFTIGAAHKKSILNKVKEFETKDSLKLNWIDFGTGLPI